MNKQEMTEYGIAETDIIALIDEAKYYTQPSIHRQNDFIEGVVAYYNKHKTLSVKQFFALGKAIRKPVSNNYSNPNELDLIDECYGLDIQHF